MNLPPLDGGSSPSVNASLVATFNGVLTSHANKFQAKHHDAMVLQFHVKKVLNHVLHKHQDYGFKNVAAFCRGYNQPDIRSDPEKYRCGEALDMCFWYDSGRLTSRVHQSFTGVLGRWLEGKSRRV
jgi:phospholipase/lecithinase/hemolysin